MSAFRPGSPLVQCGPLMSPPTTTLLGQLNPLPEAGAARPAIFAAHASAAEILADLLGQSSDRLAEASLPAPHESASDVLLRWQLFARRHGAFRPVVAIVDTCVFGAAALSASIASHTESVQIVSIDRTSIEGVYDAMLAVARVAGEEPAGRARVVALRERFFVAGEYINPFADGPTLVVLSSMRPLTIAGWCVAHLAERAGCQYPGNPTVLGANDGAAAGPQQGARRAPGPREITRTDLEALDPAYMLLCVPGQDVAGTLAAVQTHAPWIYKLRAVRDGHGAVLDGRHSLDASASGLADAYAWLIAWTQDVPMLRPQHLAWAALERGIKR
jgi:hypothetical protein